MFKASHTKPNTPPHRLRTDRANRNTGKHAPHGRNLHPEQVREPTHRRSAYHPNNAELLTPRLTQDDRLDLRDLLHPRLALGDAGAESEYVDAGVFLRQHGCVVSWCCTSLSFDSIEPYDGWCSEYVRGRALTLRLGVYAALPASEVWGAGDGRNGDAGTDACTAVGR